MSLYLGCHVSIRAGYLQAAKTAYALGAAAFQYFPKNPRSLSVKSFDEKDASACKEFCAKRGMLSIGHAPYPTNPAVGDRDLQQATIRSLKNDLAIAEHCGSIGVVVHFGKYREKELLAGYRNILAVLGEVLDGWNGKALLLLENQAGTGTPMGTTFEELVQIRRLSGHAEKIGFCLDTCHAFASGLWSEKRWEQFLRRGTETGFFSSLAAVHLNDSVYPENSGKDRHANIGQGRMSLDLLLRFLRLPEVQGVPVVLETPAGADGTHRTEIRYVRELLEKS